MSMQGRKISTNRFFLRRTLLVLCLDFNSGWETLRINTRQSSPQDAAPEVPLYPPCPQPENRCNISPTRTAQNLFGTRALQRESEELCQKNVPNRNSSPKPLSKHRQGFVRVTCVLVFISSALKLPSKHLAGAGNLSSAHPRQGQHCY